MDDQIEKEFVAVDHDFFESVNGDHGRIEQRKVWVTNQIDLLQKRYPKWSTVKSIAVVDSMRDIKGKISQEKRYFISAYSDASYAHPSEPFSVQYLLGLQRPISCEIVLLERFILMAIFLAE